MKKGLWTLVLAIIPVALSFAIGTVVEMEGRVEARTGMSWITVGVGDSVPVDAMIATGFRSRAVVQIGSSMVTVGPLSQVELASVSIGGGREEVALGLPFGEIRAEVRKSTTGGSLPEVDFRVFSPVSTAAVRGTVFTYDGVALDVSEGAVDLSNGFGQWHSVREGQSSRAYRWGLTSVESTLNEDALAQ